MLPSALSDKIQHNFIVNHSSHQRPSKHNGHCGSYRDTLSLFAARAQQGGAPEPQSSGGVPAAAPKFRVVRSVSGTKGSVKDGQYIIEDPRTVFYLPQDRQVIVYFEWEGPIGKHHFEALWKNPAGKVSAISDFDYEATAKRFAGYWTLALADDSPTGVWSLDARVDAETTGTYAFELVSAPRPENLPTARVPETPAEIYEKAGAASVFIEKLGADGVQLGLGSGFFLGDGMLVTAFQVIDGATKLRVVLHDDRRLDADEVLAWDRRADWAELRVSTENVPTLQRANADSWHVGDRCYALNASADGTRTIQEGSVTGKGSVPGAGERVNFSMYMSGAAMGSPLVDEYGDVIGVIGGRLIPGVNGLEASGIDAGDLVPRPDDFARAASGVPVTLIPAAPGQKPASLEELARTGQFLPPVTARNSLLYAELTKSVERRNGLALASAAASVFSRSDRTCFVLASWASLAKTKEKNKPQSTTSIRVYDVDNRLRTNTETLKLKLNPSAAVQTVAEVPLANLPPGIYRVDILFGDEIAWRGFFRIAQ